MSPAPQRSMPDTAPFPWSPLPFLQAGSFPALMVASLTPTTSRRNLRCGITRDRYSEPGAVVPLLNPVLLGMYATLHLGFADANLTPTPTSSVQQEVQFGET